MKSRYTKKNSYMLVRVFARQERALDVIQTLIRLQPSGHYMHRQFNIQQL